MNIYPNKRNKNHSKDEFWERHLKILQERNVINERLANLCRFTQTQEYLLWTRLLIENTDAGNLLLKQKLEDDIKDKPSNGSNSNPNSFDTEIN